ncbi:MAG: hypothetical protein ABEJ79_10900 [Halolamina sp.]
MTREKLQAASDALRQAAVAADDDRRERLYDLSNDLATLANADRGPDHGRLARLTNAIESARDGAGDAVDDHAAEARTAIDDYRETVDGV